MLINLLVIIIFCCISSITKAEVQVSMITATGEGRNYWPGWRGPSRQGYVKGSGYPDTWSNENNVNWKVSVPGEGNSSPIIWGNHLFLTTSLNDGKNLALLSFDRTNGALLWKTTIEQKGIEHAHIKNGYASSTPVTDGQLIYASFGTHGLVAINFNGQLVWHSNLTELDNYHGSAGSPILYKNSIILYQDHQKQSFVAAFKKTTGEIIWKTKRDTKTGWGTPIVIQAGKRNELIISSQHQVASYNPLNGKKLWFVEGNKFEVIPTPVIGHNLIFASSGRAGPTLAIHPGGTGNVTESHVEWKTPKGSPFVPSAILVGKQLYTLNDMQSIVTSFEATTGKVLFQARLGNAPKEGFSASPVTVDGKIFFTNDEGETFVLKAGPEFQLLHVNRLNAQTLASPALVDQKWYFRTRNELLCIGK